MRVVRLSLSTCILLSSSIVAVPSPVLAQHTSFHVAGREVQVHGSIQQGFIVSDENNFLTMETSQGSGAMTDGALNVSTQLTGKLRVGMQAYGRNIGALGDGRLQFDWAYADYRFAPAFGVRAGKVKTPLGLFSDTQDMEFLYTWALLPQSLYPLDLRSVTIAHVGGDVYGTLKRKGLGKFSYTVYGGVTPDDKRGGYRFALEDMGMAFTKSSSMTGFGTDLRWDTPVEGLLVGHSSNFSKVDTEVTGATFGNARVGINVPNLYRNTVYGDYQRDDLRVSAEWRLESSDYHFSAIVPDMHTTSTAWFAGASYRVAPLVELGSYHSRYVADTALPSSLPINHVYDTVATARFDFTRFWHVKIEGHFMDGYGSTFNAHGFYARSNPDGLMPRTNMLVVRTGLVF